jgi:hypothetical protein
MEQGHAIRNSAFHQADSDGDMTANPFDGILPRPLGYLAYAFIWTAAKIAVALAHGYAVLTGDSQLNGQTWWRKAR